MDLWQLGIFCKVVELKGFSKAAEAIHLSQPTVSSHIKDLEAHFDCRLIDRIGKTAIPTKVGEVLYDYARRLLSLRNEAESAIAQFQGEIRGRLEMGGSTIPGGYILPKIIGNFRVNHPKAVISLAIGDTDKIINSIASGELEFGIVGAQTEDQRIFQEKLVEDEMVVIVPSSHKWAMRSSIKLEQLIKEPFIIRQRGSGTMKSIQNSLIEQGMDSQQMNIAAELGSTTAVIQGIKNNVGISILSPIAVADELLAGSLRKLTVPDLNLRRSFYLTRHKERTMSPLGNAFWNFIQKTCEKKH
ncbi:LysR family transcriptional regulator [bacterium]|nr:LysR family transcriptional regulator [bacterium]